MKKLVLTIALLTNGYITYAQVGIGNINPKATLDITATNKVTPTNTDGILIPRIDAFPITPPGADQQSMMVYLTTTSGSNTPGFYYWNNTTTSWVNLDNTNTLDQAYDKRWRWSRTNYYSR